MRVGRGRALDRRESNQRVPVVSITGYATVSKLQDGHIILIIAGSSLGRVTLAAELYGRHVTFCRDETTWKHT